MTEALHPQVSLQNDPNQLKISGAALLGKWLLYRCQLSCRDTIPKTVPTGEAGSRGTKNMSLSSSQPTLTSVQNLEHSMCVRRDKVLNPHPQHLLGESDHCLALHSETSSPSPSFGSVDTAAWVKPSGDGQAHEVKAAAPSLSVHSWSATLHFPSCIIKLNKQEKPKSDGHFRVSNSLTTYHIS